MGIFDFPKKIVEMQYPNSDGINNLFDGEIHKIIPFSLTPITIKGKEFYILNYADLTYNKLSCITLLAKNGDTYIKIPLDYYDELKKIYNNNRIPKTIVGDDFPSFIPLGQSLKEEDLFNPNIVLKEENKTYDETYTFEDDYDVATKILIPPEEPKLELDKKTSNPDRPKVAFASFPFLPPDRKVEIINIEYKPKSYKKLYVPFYIDEDDKVTIGDTFTASLNNEKSKGDYKEIIYKKAPFNYTSQFFNEIVDTHYNRNLKTFEFDCIRIAPEGAKGSINGLSGSIMDTKSIWLLPGVNSYNVIFVRCKSKESFERSRKCASFITDAKYDPIYPGIDYSVIMYDSFEGEDYNTYIGLDENIIEKRKTGQKY